MTTCNLFPPPQKLSAGGIFLRINRSRYYFQSESPQSWKQKQDTYFNRGQFTIGAYYDGMKEKSSSLEPLD